MLNAVLSAMQEEKSISHFNFCTIDGLRAIFYAAKELSDEIKSEIPIIVGMSEGERDFFGISEAVAVVNSIRSRTGYPIFLNADHTYSVDRVKEAIDVGFDSVIFDGAKLSIDENIKLTRECVLYAKTKKRNVLIEGELGYIGTSSKMLDGLPAGISPENMTDPNEAKLFVDSTGVDLFSPSVGNIHGMLKHSNNPRLDINRIKEINELVKIPLVLHGGSGISDEDFISAINTGISIIHINTELRKAYRDGIDLFLKDNQDEISPYKFLGTGMDAMKITAKNRIRLFWRINAK